MFDFDFFRTSSTAEIFVERLTQVSLRECEGWDDFRTKALANRASFGGEFNEGFARNVENDFGVCSTGERALIVAILHAIDYDQLAERLCEERGTTPLEIISHADVDTRALIACCIARLAPVPEWPWLEESVQQP